METLSIGQLAAAAGVNVETVRYYERRGLLAEPPRTAAGYRQYSPTDLWRMQLIARAKALGFTLAEIQEVLGDDGQRSVERVIDAARAKIAVLDARQRELAATRERLAQLLGVCAEGDVGDCMALRLGP